MKFKIEQIAIAPADSGKAFELLKKIGMLDWTHDDVTAAGKVHGTAGVNKAHLAFNYDSGPSNDDSLEFEVLNYTSGINWIQGTTPVVSHLGMHCTENELDKWKAFFEQEGIGIAQEVYTEEHTNEYLLNNGRKYHYCIFDTKGVLGTDLKFIVRIEKQGELDV